MIRVLAVLVLLCASLGAQAKTQPVLKAPYLIDTASFLPRLDQQHLTRVLANFHTQHGIQVSLFTAPDIGNFTDSDSLDHFANSMFKHWRKDKSERYKGALLIVTKSPLGAIVKLGDAFTAKQQHDVQHTVDSVMKPKLQASQYQFAITSGLKTLTTTLATFPPIVSPPNTDLLNTSPPNRGPKIRYDICAPGRSDRPSARHSKST